MKITKTNMRAKLTFALVISLTMQYLAQASAEEKQQVKVASEQTVKQYCSVCHKLPSPDLMPAKDWPNAVKVMTDLYNTRIGHEIVNTEVSRAISAYYYLNAPVQLPILPYYNDTHSKQRFIVNTSLEKSHSPLVLNIHAVDLGLKPGVEFLVGDAEKKQVLLLNYNQGKWHETVLANVDIPLHSEVFDYDNDGDKDIIIADLGSFLPNEELVGKVIVLIQTSPGVFKKGTLLEGVGRITDVRPVDIDNDGDLDIAVAIFGGGTVGGLEWIENLGNGKHKKHSLLNDGGALNISPVDLNNDGKIDFVSLIAQEHEIAIALINKGNGVFEYKKLAQAPHPMFGFTSMELVDLDGDKDMDIVLTNGDALDLQPDPKPYHGVQWLENKGNYHFQYHEIGRFYGAAKAVAGDLDNDGDMDVVASSWNNYWQDKQRQGLVWYENNGEQQFTRHNIANRPKQIVTLELEDITGNGLLDIVAGVFGIDLLLSKILPNQTINSDTSQAKHTENIKENRIMLFENSTLTNTN